MACFVIDRAYLLIDVELRVILSQTEGGFVITPLDDHFQLGYETGSEDARMLWYFRQLSWLKCYVLNETIDLISERLVETL